MNWPEATRNIIFWIVLGWIVCSIASCTAKSQQARFHFMENASGVTVW
jgi:hypothetical protein